MSNDVIPSAEEIDALIERNKAESWKDVPVKNKAFALRYIVDYDHIAAAEEVKIPRNKALATLRDPLTSAFISFIQEETQISNIVTEDFVRTQFMNLIPMLSGQVETEHVNTSKGYGFRAKKFHAGELTSVLKELAKSTKFYENGSNSLDSSIANLGDVFREFMMKGSDGLSDEELEELSKEDDDDSTS